MILSVRVAVRCGHFIILKADYRFHINVDLKDQIDDLLFEFCVCLSHRPYNPTMVK